MTISDDIILKAQEQLLPENCYFDIERIDFIKNFDSIDLLAVPGSGKTTALLAKLFCLSKQLPFKDGSGILVLSHTNAAINVVILPSKIADVDFLKPFLILFQRPQAIFV